MFKYSAIFLSIFTLSCSIKESRKGAPRGGYLDPEKRKQQEETERKEIINPQVSTNADTTETDGEKNKPPVFLTEAKNIDVKAGNSVNIGVLAEDPDGDEVKEIILQLDKASGFPALPVDPDIGLLTFKIPEDAECATISGELVAIDTFNNKGTQDITIKIRCKTDTGEKIQHALKNICELFEDSLDKEACEAC